MYNILSMHALQTFIDFIKDIKKSWIRSSFIIMPCLSFNNFRIMSEIYDGCNFFEPLSFLKSTNQNLLREGESVLGS